MTDKRSKSPLDLIEEVAVPPRGSGLAKFRRLVQVSLIAISVIGAVPTAMTLYHSITTGIPYAEVPHRLAQQKMWTTLGGCVPSINFRALTTGAGTRVDVGACPQTGDILFRVAGQSQLPSYEWYPIKNLARSEQAPSGLWDWLVSAARADGRKSGGPDGRILLAQANATGIQVMCQAMQPKSTLVRIVKDGGTCYRETMSLMTGAVTNRKSVPCDQKCDAPVQG